MVIANVARIEKQMASAIPACIPTLKPSCGLIPAEHQCSQHTASSMTPYVIVG